MTISMKKDKKVKRRSQAWYWIGTVMWIGSILIGILYFTGIYEIIGAFFGNSKEPEIIEVVGDPNRIPDYWRGCNVRGREC